MSYWTCRTYIGSIFCLTLEDSLGRMRPSEREPFEQLSETINCISF